MKALVLAAMVLVGGMAAQFATAQEEGTMGDRFAEGKAKALEMIDKRIAGMQEMKTCVSAAADKTALKACREKHRDAMMEHRMDREESRHERKMERMRGKNQPNM